MSHLKSIRVYAQFSNLPTLNLKKPKSENNHAFIGCLVQTQTLLTLKIQLYLLSLTWPIPSYQLLTPTSHVDPHSSVQN